MNNSINVQTYVDARVIADIARAFSGMKVPHKSSYSYMFAQLIYHCRTEWEARHFQDTETALEFLASEGFSVKQGKSARVLRAMNKENFAAENAIAAPVEVEVNPERAKELKEALFDDSEEE